ncbi:unknown [Prevotella sp. CAG:485]|nr:unknown [Prevotella sp. CAG:485]
MKRLPRAVSQTAPPRKSGMRHTKGVQSAEIMGNDASTPAALSALVFSASCSIAVA